MILKTFDKDPLDILDYGIDWAAKEAPGPWLADGQTVASSLWIVPSGITKVFDSNTSTTTTIRLSEGTDEVDYECIDIITANDGQVKVASILIQVRVAGPVTIDATIGGVNSNSYPTLSEANSYFESRLDTSIWDSATDTDKMKALISATARLDEDRYVGGRVSNTQRLCFPRFGVPKPDSESFFSGYGYMGGRQYYLDTEIPQPVKDATCELAQELLTSGTVSSGQLGSLASVKMGDMLEVSFKDSTAGVIPSRISALLRGFKLYPSGVPMVRA